MLTTMAAVPASRVCSPMFRATLYAPNQQTPNPRMSNHCRPLGRHPPPPDQHQGQRQRTHDQPAQRQRSAGEMRRHPADHDERARPHDHGHDDGRQDARRQGRSCDGCSRETHRPTLATNGSDAGEPVSGRCGRRARRASCAPGRGRRRDRKFPPSTGSRRVRPARRLAPGCAMRISVEISISSVSRPTSLPCRARMPSLRRSVSASLKLCQMSACRRRSAASSSPRRRRSARGSSAWVAG